MKVNLHDQIRYARDCRGLTQLELARKARLKPATISHFETGRRVPCIRNLLVLCKALGVTPNLLLLGRE